MSAHFNISDPTCILSVWQLPCSCWLCAFLQPVLACGTSHALVCRARWVCCSGTSLRYKPGVVICGSGLVHDCGSSRGIGYFLEALVLLALFAKKVSRWSLPRHAALVPHGT